MEFFSLLGGWLPSGYRVAEKMTANLVAGFGAVDETDLEFTLVFGWGHLVPVMKVGPRNGFVGLVADFAVDQRSYP